MKTDKLTEWLLFDLVNRLSGVGDVLASDNPTLGDIEDALADVAVCCTFLSYIANDGEEPRDSPRFFGTPRYAEVSQAVESRGQHILAHIKRSSQED